MYLVGTFKQSFEPLDSFPVLRDPEDMPALYRAANEASMKAQSAFLIALKLRLYGLLVAAIGGAATATQWGSDLGPFVVVGAFAVVLAAELYTAVVRPDRVWYEGRAAAESLKTLTWRYVVRGESFDCETDRANAAFLLEVDGILQDLDHLEMSPSQGNTGPQITDAMTSIRALDYEDRRQLYLDARIRDQQTWYARKSSWNRSRWHRWTVATIVLEFLGLLAASWAAFGDLAFDFFGVVAAVVATITAWNQAKQHQNLTTAYHVTAQELGSVESELLALPAEATWASFVGEAEEAISREHTLWRASRGIRATRGPGRR